MSCSKSAEWEQDLANFQKQLDGVNKRIRDRNLKGPLVGQKVQLIKTGKSCSASNCRCGSGCQGNG